MNRQRAPASAALAVLRGRLWGGLLDVLNGLGSLLIALVMLLMCADVLLRNTFNRPVDGVAELVAASIVVIVFLQLPSALRHGRMSRVELCQEPLMRRWPRLGLGLRALFAVGGVLACALIATATWPQVLRAIARDEFLGVRGLVSFASWPLHGVVLLGAALTALQYALLAWQDLSAMVRAPALDAPHARPEGRHD